MSSQCKVVSVLLRGLATLLTDCRVISSETDDDGRPLVARTVSAERCTKKFRGYELPRHVTRSHVRQLDGMTLRVDMCDDLPANSGE